MLRPVYAAYRRSSAAASSRVTACSGEKQPPPVPRATPIPCAQTSAGPSTLPDGTSVKGMSASWAGEPAEYQSMATNPERVTGLSSAEAGQKSSTSSRASENTA